ncbi:hypothetical protein BD626DRAFT_490533 [Schizophyllum amplum]|uniref:Uncharacterized protein n=1 Tax=Schizophyllum amplum TaxID=97359 RepID=A0A550CJQ3_9AGAR|nr:hypothetical protein BD626DRAFT_490533 [Auriculariopsis ampla]
MRTLRRCSRIIPPRNNSTGYPQDRPCSRRHRCPSAAAAVERRRQSAAQGSARTRPAGARRSTPGRVAEDLGNTLLDRGSLGLRRYSARHSVPLYAASGSSTGMPRHNAEELLNTSPVPLRPAEVVYARDPRVSNAKARASSAARCTHQIFHSPWGGG